MGKLVVFEGIDGTGKSTLSRMLVEALTASGTPSVLYEDIEETASGFNTLKPYVRKRCDITTSFYFYLASALHKSHVIEDKLSEGVWVVCDRYVYSTIAHHLAHGLQESLVPHIATFPIKLPDYIFIITLDEATRLERVRARDGDASLDLQPKNKSTALGKKERVLLSFPGSHVVDNSADNPIHALEKIRQILEC